jgi:hypothetical protein
MHDLALVDGDLVPIDGDLATVQEIRTRLLFFKGESFTDAREGTPWLQEVLVKGGDPNRVRAIVKAVLLSVPSIVDVVSVEIDLDRTTRRATISWVARTDTGRVIRSADYPAMIV